MERIARARHPAVLPQLAFYCAAQEKLVVYEFQSNDSLHRQLHGTPSSSSCGGLKLRSGIIMATKAEEEHGLAAQAERGLEIELEVVPGDRAI